MQHARSWKLRTRTLVLDKPVFMGIINVTPDSFSDGGAFFEPSRAVDRALQLVENGAEILDVGAESTRPGSEGVDAGEELRRLIPVLEKLSEVLPQVPISVDTVKAVVAREAIRAGAEIVNDVSSCADPDMPGLLFETGAGYCLMHSQGPPKTMQDHPRYGDVVEEVYEFLRVRCGQLIAAGIEPERLAVDPGLGFGKTAAHNWTLVENVERFHELGAPLLVGHSRKRFIADRFTDRAAGTRVVTQMLIDKGVQVIRLHEIERLS